MSLGILGKTSLGATSTKYPWHSFSQDTLELQLATNQALQAAGYCHVPASGVLDGATCGARSFLTIHSRELFGSDMSFGLPPACREHEGFDRTTGQFTDPDPPTRPVKGCFEPTELKPDQKIGTKLTNDDWILVGGVASILLAGYLALTYSGAKRPQHA